MTSAAAVCLSLLALALPALGAPFVGTPAGQILTAGNNRVLLLSPAGEVRWQYPTKLTHDAWMMANGNVLFADGETVTEVTREKKVVFQYCPAEQKGGGAYACQRLANGNTMVGENSTGRVLELDATGKVVFTLNTTPFKAGEHHNMRMARKLDNGHYLVCHSGARLVKEYAPDGKVVWEVKAPGGVAFAAVRTPQGTTLVSSLGQITEYDAAGAKVWEFTTKDCPGVFLQNLTGLHLLANGNIVTGCYQAYRDGEGCGLLEITRERQLVWRYVQPKQDTTMMSVQLLTPEGAPLPGPCRR